METNLKITARSASLDELLAVVALYLSPVPHRDTLRNWFDNAKIPRFKANPTAKRGGGIVFYSVSHVEKLLRSLTVKIQ